MVVESELIADPRAGKTLRVKPNGLVCVGCIHTARGVDTAISQVLRSGGAGDPELSSYLPYVVHETVAVDEVIDLYWAHLPGLATALLVAITLMGLIGRPEEKSPR